jgi:hypothetical protein
MHTVGSFSPDTVADARDRYDALGSTAQIVVKETAKAMDFGASEYDERVTGDVIETARDALFASLLAVRVGTRAEFEAWRADHPEYDVAEVGSEHVEHVVWHAVPFAETAVAASFQREERAAVETLRRQAFGRIYRDALADGDDATLDESERTTESGE